MNLWIRTVRNRSVAEIHEEMRACLWVRLILLLQHFNVLVTEAMLLEVSQPLQVKIYQ